MQIFIVSAFLYASNNIFLYLLLSEHRNNFFKELQEITPIFNSMSANEKFCYILQKRVREPTRVKLKPHPKKKKISRRNEIFSRRNENISRTNDIFFSRTNENISRRNEIFSQRNENISRRNDMVSRTNENISLRNEIFNSPEPMANKVSILYTNGPSSVVVRPLSSTLSNLNICEASWPILIKFYV